MLPARHFTLMVEWQWYKANFFHCKICIHVVICLRLIKKYNSVEETDAMSDVFDRVKKIVIDNLSVEDDKISPEASFIDDLGADSLDLVELVMAFEEEFDIEIPDDVQENIRTVGDAVTHIEKHLS